MIRGRCLCGEVTWQAEGPPGSMSHCHCSMCRKAHGTAFATYLSVPKDRFAWRTGEQRIVHYASSPGLCRPFCSRCGSVLPGEFGDEDISVPAGNLDGDPGVRPAAHIFVASAAPWWPRRDALPAFDAYPPGYDAPEARPAPPAPPRTGITRGTCLCGDVRFEISGRHETIFCCHCSRCRRARSAAHATNLFVGVDAFRWLEGEDRVRAYHVPDAERFAQGFCQRCGSCMPRVARDHVMVPAGGLDDDPGARPGLHIHVASKAPWYDIEDDLPQHPEGPGSGNA